MSECLDRGTNLEALGPEAEDLSFELLTSAGTDDDEGDDKEDTGLTFSGKPEVRNASRKRSLVGSTIPHVYYVLLTTSY